MSLSRGVHYHYAVIVDCSRQDNEVTNVPMRNGQAPFKIDQNDRDLLAKPKDKYLQGSGRTAAGLSG